MDSDTLPFDFPTFPFESFPSRRSKDSGNSGSVMYSSIPLNIPERVEPKGIEITKDIKIPERIENYLLKSQMKSLCNREIKERKLLYNIYNDSIFRLITRLRENARKRSIAYNLYNRAQFISRSYVKSLVDNVSRCAVCRIPFSCEFPHINYISIGRKDKDQGYINNNCQLICKECYRKQGYY